MKNLIFTFLACCSLLVLFLGSYSIHYKNRVFDQSILPCCDNALCENTNPNNHVKCTSLTLGMVKTECREIYMTCRTCIDYTYSNCLCTSGSQYCLEPNGTLYFGQSVECPPNSNKIDN